MKVMEFVSKIKEKAVPWAEASWAFIRQTFSDKLNLIRFALASVAVVVTAQLLPGIVIASFWVALWIIVTMIALMTGARHALEKMKIPFNLYSYGIFLWLSNTMLLLFYDWILWYFETQNAGWVTIYSLILAVFNCIIEDLLKDETN